ncbi:MAG: hypothetical protein K6F09_02090 [Clostridiales bacterium]|nr:hypothetical protein [Clostridiales bacterium]
MEFDVIEYNEEAEEAARKAALKKKKLAEKIKKFKKLSGRTAVKIGAFALAAVLVFALGLSYITFTIDPLYHYRTPKNSEKIPIAYPYLQNVGAAANARYGALVTGALNGGIDASYLSGIDGGNVLTLTFPGGNMGDFKSLFDASFSGRSAVRTVYFGLENYLITGEKPIEKSGGKIPRSLANGRSPDDLGYLLTFGLFQKHFASKTPDASKYSFSSEDVLAGYSRSEKADEDYDERYYLDFARKSTDVLIDVIVNHPETEFIFYAPPYSILYWDDAIQNGRAKAEFTALKFAYGRLLQCGNVRIYYFQNMKGVTSNLDNYRDIYHYSDNIKRLVAEKLSDKTYRLIQSDCEKKLDAAYKKILKYNYTKLLNSDLKQ